MSQTPRTSPAASHPYELTRFNALRHGVLSEHTVLPWENGDDYRRLTEALVAEHAPLGPTEEHFVEEVAGIIWRKRRLRLAEGAIHRQGLANTLSPHRQTAKAALAHLDVADPERVIDVVRSTMTDTDDDRADLAADRALTERGLAILGSCRNDAYESGLAALREDTQEWWAETLAQRADELEDDEQLPTADAAGLRRFIEDEVMPWFETRERDLANRPLIREQAYGEAIDPDRLDRLARYEVHLDRKLERTLSMLVRLQELREGKTQSSVSQIRPGTTAA